MFNKKVKNALLYKFQNKTAIMNIYMLQFINKYLLFENFVYFFVLHAVL